MSIGSILKEAREEQGLTIKNIQVKTKIRTKYLQALEDDNYDIIPGDAYVKAFIKGYTKQLGIDGSILIKEYEELKTKEKEAKILESGIEEKKHKSKIANILIMAIVVFIIAFVVYIVFSFNQSQEGFVEIQDEESSLSSSKIEKDILNSEGFDINQQISQKPLTTPQLIIPQNTLDKNNYDNKIVQNQDREDNNTMSIIIEEKSWLQIWVDGEKSFEGILEKGQSKEYNGNNKLVLKIGNAAGVIVKKGDEIIGPWGKRGEVIEKVFYF